jgi:hypothetical protein
MKLVAEIVGTFVACCVAWFLGYQLGEHDVKTHTVVKVFAYDTPGGYTYFGKCARVGMDEACATGSGDVQPHLCSDKEIGSFPREPGWRGLCE